MLQVDRTILHAKAVVVYQSDSLAVIDEFLPADVLDELRTFFRSHSYLKVGPADRWNKNWHLCDGPAYYSGLKPYWYRLRETEQQAERVINEVGEFREILEDSMMVYPTHKPIDRMFEYLDLAVRAQSEIFENYLREGSRMSARSAVYPVGSALRYHNDAHYKGSYTFYIHPHWDSEWGGELEVLEANVGDIHALLDESAFDNRRVNDLISSLGIAHAIIPKPNRLILLAPGRLHKISRIAPSAGSNLRISIQGFMI